MTFIITYRFPGPILSDSVLKKPGGGRQFEQPSPRHAPSKMLPMRNCKWDEWGGKKSYRKESQPTQLLNIIIWSYLKPLNLEMVFMQYRVTENIDLHHAPRISWKKKKSPYVSQTRDGWISWSWWIFRIQYFRSLGS